MKRICLSCSTTQQQQRTNSHELAAGPLAFEGIQENTQVSARYNNI